MGRIALFLLCNDPHLDQQHQSQISWIPFLGRNGIPNSALISWGVVDEPLDAACLADFARDPCLVHLILVMWFSDLNT